MECTVHTDKPLTWHLGIPAKLRRNSGLLLTTPRKFSVVDVNNRRTATNTSTGGLLIRKEPHRPDRRTRGSGTIQDQTEPTASELRSIAFFDPSMPQPFGVLLLPFGKKRGLFRLLASSWQPASGPFGIWIGHPHHRTEPHLAALLPSFFQCSRQ